MKEAAPWEFPQIFLNYDTFCALFISLLCKDFWIKNKNLCVRFLEEINTLLLLLPLKTHTQKTKQLLSLLPLNLFWVGKHFETGWSWTSKSPMTFSIPWIYFAILLGIRTTRRIVMFLPGPSGELVPFADLPRCAGFLCAAAKAWQGIYTCWFICINANLETRIIIELGRHQCS